MSVFDDGKKKITDLKATINNPFKKTVKKGLDGPDFENGFVIEEQSGHEKEKIVLAGSYMPKDTLPHGGEQKIVKDYYPGNSEPVVQVLGPRENDIVIKGRFYDKRLPREINGQKAYGAADEVAKQLDAFRIRGNLLKITLGSFKRYVFLEKTNFQMKRLGDIEYELTFSVVGIQSPPRNYLFIKEEGGVPFSINKELNKAVAALFITQSKLPVTLSQSLSEKMNGYIGDAAAAMKLVTSFVDSAFQQVDDVKKSINRAIGLTKYAQGKIREYKRKLGRITSLAIDPVGVGGSPVPTRYAHSALIAGLVSDANGYSSLLAQLKKRFELIAKTVPLQRHRVVAGETLQTISMDVYGNADHWKLIYDHNKLTTTGLTTGSVLEIPRL